MLRVQYSLLILVFHSTFAFGQCIKIDDTVQYIDVIVDLDSIGNFFCNCNFS